MSDKLENLSKLHGSEKNVIIQEADDWIKFSRIRFTQFNRQHFNANYARREVEITKRYNCNTLAFFVDLDGWLIYPSKFAPFEETIVQTDLLREIVKECKKEHIRLVACWMGMHCQTYHIRQHPEWLTKHYSSLFKDSPFTKGSEAEQKFVLCLNSPYRQVLLGEVEEVLRSYEIDGIYFDGVYRIAGYCYCQYCQEKFNKVYGRSIPKDFNDPDWIQFVKDYTSDFSCDVKKLIDKYSARCKLFQDCHGTLIGTYDSQENIEGCSKYVDSFILESYHEYSGEPPTFVAMESQLVRLEIGKPVSHARWVMRSPGGIQTCISESSTLIWLFDAVATGGAPVVVDQEGFWYDRSLEKPIGNFFARLAELESVLIDSEPVKYVALLHSLTCKKQRIPKDIKTARAHFEGYYLVLEQNHIPFDIITEEDVLDGCLDKYACLVLPNIEFMDDEVASRIKQFSYSGGGIVASYRTSFCTADGKSRKKPALADLLGIDEIKGGFCRGVTLVIPHYDYDLPSLTEPVNYYEIVARHPVTEGLLMKNLYSFSGAVVDIQPAKGSKALARLKNYNQKDVNSGRFFRWSLTDEFGQDIIFVREEQARTVYFAIDLDRAYWSFGYSDAGRLLSQAVIWAASRSPVVKIDTSPLIAMRVRRHSKKNITSIHLTNYAINQLFLPGFGGAFLDNPQDLSRKHKVENMLPVCNIKIKLDIGKGGLQNCYSFTSQKLSWEKKDNCLEITVPYVKEGEIIVVEM